MDTYFDSRVYLDFLIEFCDDTSGSTKDRVIGAPLTTEYLSIAQLEPNETVLEVGCGTGRVLEIMQRSFGVDVYGCDICSYAIEHLKASRPEFSGKVRTLDSHGLEVYPAGSFDWMVYWGVFELCPQRAYLAEAARILRPGGQAFLGSIKHVNPLDDDIDAHAAIRAYREKKFPISLTDPERFETYLAALGFELVRRIVLERKSDLVAGRYDIDQGGARRFSEAIYVIRKLGESALATDFNQHFGR